MLRDSIVVVDGEHRDVVVVVSEENNERRTQVMQNVLTIINFQDNRGKCGTSSKTKLNFDLNLYLSHDELAPTSC